MPISPRLHADAYSHADKYSKFRPKPPQALIEEIVQFLSEQMTPPFQCAVDVGCGNGQSTSILAPYFDAVYGQDVNGAQIEEATKIEQNSNVSYRVSPAESLNYPAASVNLVTSCMAAHWFDMPKFYESVDRILKPNGVVTLYGYKLPQAIFRDNADLLKDFIVDMYLIDMDGYLLPGGKDVYIDNYSGRRFRSPYDTEIYIRDDERFSHSLSSNVEKLVGYVETWGSYQNMRRHEPERAENAINKFTKRIMDALQVASSPIDTPLTVVFPYFLLIARKPAS